MKKLSYLFSAAVLALLLVSVGCDSGGDDSTPAVDQVGNNFTGTWGIATAANSVTFDTEDRTDDYSGFQLTITYTAGQDGGTVSMSGASSEVGLRPFLASDTWTFSPVPTDGATPNFSIVRGSDSKTMVISNFSAAGMTLTFNNDGSTSISRTEATNGDWNFILVKQ